MIVAALRRTTVALLLLAAALLGTATPAAAHPTLLFTDPAADTATPDSPPVISLVFNETVTAGPHAITLVDRDGRPIPIGPTTTARDATVVTARPAAALPPGTYTVRWQVTGSDGDQVDEEFRFAVGTAISAAGTSGGASIAGAEAALRWLLFAGLALASAARWASGSPPRPARRNPPCARSGRGPCPARWPAWAG